MYPENYKSLVYSYLSWYANELAITLRGKFISKIPERTQVSLYIDEWCKEEELKAILHKTLIVYVFKQNLQFTNTVTGQESL